MTGEIDPVQNTKKLLILSRSGQLVSFHPSTGAASVATLPEDKNWSAATATTGSSGIIVSTPANPTVLTLTLAGN